MIIAGIDPGKNGALFLLSDSGYPYMKGAYRVPLITPKVVKTLKRDEKGKRIKKQPKTHPDYEQMAREWAGALIFADAIFMEQVGAMPGQGTASMFNFGHVTGFAYALALASGKPVRKLTPQTWKARVGLDGSDAKESIAMATVLMPHCQEYWPLCKDDGVAEAALIAYAGKLILGEKK